MATCPTCGQKIPDVVVPQPGIKPYPLKVIFDKTSDQGTGEYHGTSCLLLDPGMVKVTLNGEVAFKGNPYKGKDVWRFKKVGDAYPKPWNFVFTHSTGQQYSYVINESGGTPANPDTPTGGKTLTVKNSGQANGNRSHFRFPSKVAVYGNFSFSFDGGKVHYVTAEQVKDGRHEPGGGVLVKSPDNRGGTAILGEYGKTYKSCTLKW